jgi:hypothetical protein
MPRVRTVTAPAGFLHFSPGVPPECIREVAKENQITEQSTHVNGAGETCLKVPSTAADGSQIFYVLPDHLYVWVNFPEGATKGFVLR